MQKYLQSTWFINSDADEIAAFTEQHIAGRETDLDKAVSLYYAVRDLIVYNPFVFSFKRNEYQASFALNMGEGFCIQKALLLAAVARAAGIPARPGFANVLNHQNPENIRKILNSDLYVFHGYTEMYLENKWVKATPAFNISMKEKFGYNIPEFNGREDSGFHPLNLAGEKHMEYVHDYGTFEDYPFELFIDEYKKHYPQYESVIGREDLELDADSFLKS